MEGKFESDVRIKTVEMHTGGEPLRIIVSGFPKPKGQTILEKRQYIRENFDHYRKLVVFEPRGHYDVFCSLLVEPDLPDADLAVLFLDNDGYTTMCGHGVIALGRYAIDYRIIKNPTSPETRVNIQCPCGMVTVYVEYDGKKTGAVRFHSVPTYVFNTDVEIDVEGYGKVKLDIVYSGAFYAIVPANALGLNIESTKLRHLVDAADQVSAAVRKTITFVSNLDKQMEFLHGTLITESSDISDVSLTNLNVFADKQLDRSPCGSGVAARMALMYHKGLIKLDENKEFQSKATNALFTSKVVKETMVQQNKGVVVEVSGKGFYTGSSEFTLEDDDVIGRGFLVY